MIRVGLHPRRRAQRALDGLAGGERSIPQRIGGAAKTRSKSMLAIEAMAEASALTESYGLAALDCLDFVTS
jgi:hypothetical protein